MGQVASDTTRVSGIACRLSPVTGLLSGFTLIELLTVISILGIIAALTVPALKEFGKSDASVTAGQQLLRDVARARQLAIADRTTVYMVFVPAGFFTNTAWYNQLTPAQQTLASNLCESQLTGYTFVAFGALGDQPGNHRWHYLAPWQNLPQGTFIAPWKFDGTFGARPVPRSPFPTRPIRKVRSGSIRSTTSRASRSLRRPRRTTWPPGSGCPTCSSITRASWSARLTRTLPAAAKIFRW